jgi:hypothetical protein
MKLSYTTSSKEIKQKYLQEYKRIGNYFEMLEASIIEKPFDSIQETIIIQGKKVISYKNVGSCRLL